MKFLYCTTVVLNLILVSCDSSKQNINEPALRDTVLYQHHTSMKWQDTFIDIGTVDEGQKTPISFKFKNTGQSPLVIFEVVPTCGCTIPQFTKDPIVPGAEDSVVALFNSEGKEGPYLKSIKVRCNTDENFKNLQFKVNVNPPKKIFN